MLVVGKPSLLNPELFKQRVEEILDRGQLTNNGPFVTQLEEAVGDWYGAHVVAVSNATVGLQLASLTLPIHTIAVPSFSFIASAHAFYDMDVELCDVKEATFGIDLKRIGDVDSICPVNLFGGYAELENLPPVFPTILDSAHALGCEYMGERTWGDCEVFSLHATKFIQGAEGGLVVTRDFAIADQLRKLRNFGYGLKPGSRDGIVVEWGTNAKMSEFHAALALTNWESLETLRSIYQHKWQIYNENLPREVNLYDPQADSRVTKSNYSYVVIQVENRDKLADHLYENGIFARKYFAPIHHTPPYDYGQILKNTVALSAKVLCLPTGPNVEDHDIKRICSTICEFI